MRSLPTHRNRYTGEILANSVEVCPACHLNFASTRAGDKHRATRDEKRVCLSPVDSGLEAYTNQHGAVLWRVPRNPPLVPTPVPHLDLETSPEAFHLTV
jgi:hypothetical protein